MNASASIASVEKRSGRSFLFLISFSATLAILLLCLDFFARGTLGNSGRLNKMAALENFRASAKNISYLSIKELSATEAKAQKLFWANNGSDAFAIDLRKSEVDLDSLFPGYGQLLTQNQDFWDEYFQLEFSPSSFLHAEPGLSQQGYLVSYSWTGCLRLHERFGSDVVVLGTSEVYESIVAGELAAQLSRSLGYSPRVLFCPTFGLSPKMAQFISQELQKHSQKKPKIVLWGYSFWLAFSNSKLLQEYEKEKSQQLSEYLSMRASWQEKKEGAASFFRRMEKITMADFFPRISWDDVMRFNLQKLRQSAPAAISSDSQQESLRFDRQILAGSDRELKEYLEKNLKPYYSIMSGVGDKDCLMNQQSDALEKTLDSLKNLAEEVFVYIPPTTDHHLRTAPSCFLPAVREMLSRQANRSGTHYLEADRSFFTLTERDYAWEVPSEPNKIRFDINHTSYSGALKVTRGISKWISEKLKVEGQE